MKPKGTILLGVLVSVLVLGPSPDVSAQGRGRSKGAGFCKGRAMGANRLLDLSDQQRETLNQLREQHQQTVSQIETELDLKRAEMHKLMSAEQLDRQAIESKHAEMQPLRQELRNARHKHRLDMLALLTPEQRVQWLKQRAQAPRGAKGYHRGWGKHRARGRCNSWD